MTDATRPGVEIRAFRTDIPQEAPDDLHNRPGRGVRPSEIPDAGWDHGVPLGYVIGEPDLLVGDMRGFVLGLR
jgi:hypothetical protein